MAMRWTSWNEIEPYLQQHYNLGDGCWLKKQPTKQRPKIGFNGKTPFLINVLYEIKYGYKPTLLRQCPQSPMCVNPDHAIAPSSADRRRYRKHTDECGGHDWVMVDLVTQAGTIDVLPSDTLICDCDRAAIALKAPSINIATQWLKISHQTVTRLIDLGHTLWPTSTPS